MRGAEKQKQVVKLLTGQSIWPGADGLNSAWAEVTRDSSMHSCGVARPTVARKHLGKTRKLMAKKITQLIEEPANGTVNITK